MKQSIIYLLLILGVSCTSDDRILENESSYELKGSWSLVRSDCECQPLSLEIGVHIWSFNLTTNTVNVQNNYMQENPDHIILESGNYTLTVNDSKITLSGYTFDYYFENNKLYLTDNPESDGPFMEFIKN